MAGKTVANVFGLKIIEPIFQRRLLPKYMTISDSPSSLQLQNDCNYCTGEPYTRVCIALLGQPICLHHLMLDLFCDRCIFLFANCWDLAPRSVHSVRSVAPIPYPTKLKGYTYKGMYRPERSYLEPSYEVREIHW